MLSVQDFRNRGADTIYQSEVEELQKLFPPGLVNELHTKVCDIRTSELKRAIQNIEKRTALYQAVADFARQNADKRLLYRANRLFERTPLMLSETERLTERCCSLPMEYIGVVEEILFSDSFLRLRAFQHHQDVSTFTHSLGVSLYAYQIAKKRRLDYWAAAVGGLLHDYYLYDWHMYSPEMAAEGDCYEAGFFELHFFTHGFIAAANAARDFPGFVGQSYDDKVRNIISCHIPLGRLAPRRDRLEQVALSKEARVVRRCDLLSSLDILKHPLKNIGIDSSSKL